MSLRPIAALFATPAEATQAYDELKAAGFSRVEVSAVEDNVPALDANAGIYDVAREAAHTNDAAPAPFFRQHDSSASSFADELTALGFTKADAEQFIDGLVRGGSLITVDASPDVERAREILARFDAHVREAAVVEGSEQVTGVTIDAGESGGDATTLHLRAERLEVSKRLVRHGQATVRKETITEMRTIEVPVTREELVIEREPAAAGTLSGESIGPAEEIRIALSEERVSVEKHAVVLEEVEIGTRRVAETEHVSESVRHEELRVDPASERF